MKSLSKGNNSKKDTLASTLNLRGSTTLPLSSVLPPRPTYEDDIGDSWPEHSDGEEIDGSIEFEEPEKSLSKKNGRIEAYNISNLEDKARKVNGQTKLKVPTKFDSKSSHSDDDLNALLKVRIVKHSYQPRWFNFLTLVFSSDSIFLSFKLNTPVAVFHVPGRGRSS